MQTIEEHVDIPLPAADAYSQATQFESMSSFLRAVQAVEQLDDRRLLMRFSDRGWSTQLDAEITEQIPDKRIAWTSSSHPTCSGCLTFHRLDDDHSRMMVQIGLDIDGDRELVDRLRHAVTENLGDFQDFLSRRRTPTGRWGGTLLAPDERSLGGEEEE